MTVSTKNTHPARAPVRKVDFSEAPEVKGLAEHARRIGNEMYSKILALLADDSSTLPRRFDIVFKRHIEGNFGQTVGATINLRAEWFAKNPTDLDETLIHEISHVAQKYPSKAWDYWGEGIADYVCYKLGYTNEWNWPHCSFEYPHYTSGYLLFDHRRRAVGNCNEHGGPVPTGAYSRTIPFQEIRIDADQLV